MTRKVRIGIDVGGTFTDASVIDHESGELISKEKIPTTHHHEYGVAYGITSIVKKMIQDLNISPDDVVFIAHGTTQATNALLEGDVARVGVIGIGGSSMAKNELDLQNIELTKGKYLYVETVYMDTKNYSKDTVMSAIDQLVNKGCQVIVVSEAYSIDNPERELEVVEWCQEKGIFATAGHEVSQLYGLKVRTTTAVINASLVPKMMETADMTERVVKEIGIGSELMIMRADGGVMSINEVRKRPILTMLSGLAAGVAGALMYGKVTEGIFLEVGGTSTDISVIRDGKVMIKNASVGGHKTYLRSLDIRTLGVAGGSMVRIEDGKVIDVGPRSAHLADQPYECFNEMRGNGVIHLITPCKGDPNDYAIVEDEDGKTFAFTIAGASNVLGYVPEGDYAYSTSSTNLKAWEVLGEYCGKSAQEIAKEVIDVASKKVWAIVEELIEEYKLDRDFLSLVGGGGSASVITNPLGVLNNTRHGITENAAFISTIGVAMAMIREQIDRSIMNPTKEDIRQIRRDVLDKIMQSGAKEDSIEVFIEIDDKKKIVSAIATGATEFKSLDQMIKLSEEELVGIVADGIKVPKEEVTCACNLGKWSIFEHLEVKKKLFGLSKSVVKTLVLSDQGGTLLLRKREAECVHSTPLSYQEDMMSIIDALSQFSDAGKTIPEIYAISASRLFDYSGILDEQKLMEVMEMDFEYLNKDEPIVIIGAKHR